mmetsp:Transcript_16661/g.39891  ORF Transcript_16661/g.39891 Transcript_16661/m.39891 type:complete len:328 (+) Transcript_16661:230-1213(+)
MRESERVRAAGTLPPCAPPAPPLPSPPPPLLALFRVSLTRVSGVSACPRFPLLVGVPPAAPASSAPPAPRALLLFLAGASDSVLWLWLWLCLPRGCLPLPLVAPAATPAPACSLSSAAISSSSLSMSLSKSLPDSLRSARARSSSLSNELLAVRSLVMLSSSCLAWRYSALSVAGTSTLSSTSRGAVRPPGWRNMPWTTSHFPFSCGAARQCFLPCLLLNACRSATDGNTMVDPSSRHHTWSRSRRLMSGATSRFATRTWFTAYRAPRGSSASGGSLKRTRPCWSSSMLSGLTIGRFMTPRITAQRCASFSITSTSCSLSTTSACSF